MNYEIRPATLKEAPLLAELGRTTFFETFAPFNSPEDMAEHLHLTFHPDLQKKEIQDPSRRLFLAWQEGTPVGYVHLKLGSSHPSISDPFPLEILRFYVVSTAQGKGLAHDLMNWCIDQGRIMNFKTLWLGVWEKNVKAQRFYAKWGFKEVGSHIFRLGKDPQRDLLLEKRI